MTHVRHAGGFFVIVAAIRLLSGEILLLPGITDLRIRLPLFHVHGEGDSPTDQAALAAADDVPRHG